MGSHIQEISEVCTLLLLFLFAIGSYQSYDRLLDLFVKLPYLFDDYDPKAEACPASEWRAQLESCVKFRTARTSSKTTLRKLQKFHKRGMLPKLLPFLHPELRTLVQTLVEGSIHPDFQLPDPSKVPPYINSRVKSKQPGVYLGGLPIDRGFLVGQKEMRVGSFFSAPKIPQQTYIESLNFTPSTVLVGHQKNVFCLAYDAVGSRIFTGSDDALIKVWDLKTGGLLFTMNGHSAPVSDFHLFDDGHHLISCDTVGFIVLWDLSTGKVESKRRLSNLGICNVFFMPANFGKNFSIFAATMNGKCYHLEVEPDFYFSPDLTEISETLYKGKKMLAACRNSAGTLIAYGGEDFMIYIAQPRLVMSPEVLKDMEGICQPNRLKWEEPQIKAILHGHTFQIATLEFNKKGNRLLSCSQDNTARIWTFEPATEVWTCVIMGENIDFDFEDGVVRTLQKGHKVRDSMPKGLDHNICSVAWAADDDIILVSYDSGLIRMFCSHSGHFLCSAELSKSPIHALAPHPTNSDFVLVACYEGNVDIVDVHTGRQLRHWDHGEETCFIEAKWSPTGEHFSLTAVGGKCYTYTAAFDLPHIVPAISGVEQCLSSDFVNLTATTSFPIHGTETRRNEFQKYDLKNFNCDTQPDEFQKPANFGSEYLVNSLYEPPFDPSTLPLVYEQLCWPSLATVNELPKKYQYQKYRREHLNLFEEAVINEDMEPVVMPKSPNDADYILPTIVSSDEDSDLMSGSISHHSACSDAVSPPRTRRRAREDYPSEKRARRTRYPTRKTRSQPQYVDSFSSSHSQNNESSEGEAEATPDQLRELANRMDLDGYPLPDGVKLNAEWAKLVDQHPANYFPQVNDPIVYLVSGHREYAKLSKIEPVIASCPSLSGHPQLSFVERGVVQSIKFSTTDSTALAEFRLRLESGSVITAVLGPQLPRFIVHQSIYDAARPPTEGASVQIHGRGDFHTVTRVTLGKDPWNAVQMQNNPGSFGCWELASPPPFVSLDAQKVKLYSRVIDQLTQDRHFDDFIDQIDLITYPEYLNFVASPMFLSLIRLRLEQGFYRSDAALIKDIQLILSNARAFNESDSDIVRLAKSLVARFRVLVKDAPKSTSASDSEGSSPAPRASKRARPAQDFKPKKQRKMKIESDDESIVSPSSAAISEEDEDEVELPPKKRGRPTRARPSSGDTHKTGRSLRPRKPVNYSVTIDLDDSSDAPISRRPNRSIVLSDDE